MKIEPLDDKTVKVVLSKEDMNSYKITYDEMDYDNPDTRRIIIKLLDEVKHQTEIDLSKGKLYIEAFPYADGGCILYVNVIDSSITASSNIKKRQGFDTPLIFYFDDITALGNVCKRLSLNFGHIILKSSLYLFDEKYFLLIYTYFKMDEQISCLLNEYGNYYGKGGIKAAIIKEHYDELIKADALKVLEECL